MALVAVPALLLVAGLLAVIAESRHLPSALGLALALAAVTIAASGLVAVRAPFPVPETTSAFGTGSPGQGCSAGLLTLAALLASAALCLPLLALLIPALSRPGYGIALLIAGPAYGLAVGSVLRGIAARRWAVRGPEVLGVLAVAR